MIAFQHNLWRYDKMAKLPEGRKPLTMNDLASLDIMQNGIYNTVDIIKQDTLWLARLRVIADDLDSDEVRQIADRFESLTTTAHNRKHWTGHE